MIKELNLQLTQKNRNKKIIKKKKDIFNPFDIDLSTNTEKILGINLQNENIHMPSRKNVLKSQRKTQYKNTEILNHLENDVETIVDPSGDSRQLNYEKMKKKAI